MGKQRMIGPATEGRMGELHRQFADLIAEMLKGEDVMDEETREMVHYDPSPAVLGVARQFLKDNDITCALDQTESGSQIADTIKKHQAAAKGRVKRFGDSNVANMADYAEN